MSNSSDMEAVSAFLRAHDRDHYLAALFAPKAVRADLMALYAFGAEISRIPDLVSEPALGEIRLQWWRDELGTVASGNRTGSPVADSLGHAIRKHGLSKAMLTGMIDARTFDLSGMPMPDMQAFRVYLEKTEGNLFVLAARIIAGKEPDKDLVTVGRYAGFAWGAARLLRMLPRHLSRGRFYLPESRFRDHGADPEQMLLGATDENARAALLELRDEVREAFGYTRAHVHAAPRETALAFLPCALVPRYLAALEGQAASPLDAVADINPLRRIACLARAALRGRFE